MQGERYSRQLQLKDFGPEAQAKLTKARVLVVGAGGLGVPVLTYLNAMGVGTLGIVEEDIVSITNLHRQVLYDRDEVGHAKLDIAIGKLKKQNPDTELIPYYDFLTLDNALTIIKGYDLVIDATDNFPTRYLINDACVLLKKPFVYGALHGFEGQVSVFNHNNGPTYRCLFPNMPSAAEVPNCNEHGVLGVIPGIVGNLQALEAVKVVTGVGEVLSGKLLLFNGLDQTFRKIKFKAIPANLRITALQEAYGFACGFDEDSIETADFEKLLDDDIQIIDVRTVEEYGEFHLANSINLPLERIEDWKNTIDYDRPVYVLCHSGSRSLEAQSILKAYRNGSNIININGGIEQLKRYAIKY